MPEEHDLTFSWLNTNVIQVGLMFLLVTDATGPVYGWAQYTFSAESGLCILDPGSPYVTTYISVSLPLYYFLPLLVTTCCHALMILQQHSYNEEDEYPFPSRIIPSGRHGQILLCFTCILPFLGRLPSVLAVVICSSKLISDERSSSEEDTNDIDEICRGGKLDFFLVWFKFFSITCVLPIFLLLGSQNLRKHVKLCFITKIVHTLCKWKHSTDDLQAPMELSVRSKPAPSAPYTNRTLEGDVIEII